MLIAKARLSTDNSRIWQLENVVGGAKYKRIYTSKPTVTIFLACSYFICQDYGELSKYEVYSRYG